MSHQLPIRVLIVDDRQETRHLCEAIVQGMGLACLHAAGVDEALDQVGKDAPELMLADLSMGDMSGLELLAEVKKRAPQTEVALVSASGNSERAVEAMRLGAYDFVVKPFGEEKISLILGRMVEKVRLVRENEYLRKVLQRETKSRRASAQLCTDLEELERQTVRRVFEQVHGNKEQAQKLLGISRATLYRKIKRYGIKAGRRAPKQGLREAEERMILLSQS
jgi:DNA-binding NtrC family response regulator